MWRYASLSIPVLAFVTGCQMFDKPAAPVAAAPAQTVAAPEPPAPPPPPPEAAPLPAQKPAQFATTAPEPVPAGADPKELVGLDFVQTQRLLGLPSKQEEKPPAKVWVYNGTECDLTIFFYSDINTREFRALTYEFTNHQATEGTDDQCLAQLMQGT